MFSAIRRIPYPTRRAATQLRTVATQSQKRAGDISDAFASLSGHDFKPLAPGYAAIKTRLIQGYEDQVRESWERLLRSLQEEIPLIVELGSKVIPDIDFKDIDNAPEAFSSELRKRGVAVVRGVVSEKEALQWKEDLREYIRQNPHTKAYPTDNPQVFELYWSRSQLLARGHPNLLKTHRFLMSYWHSANPHVPLSTKHPISYADRLRMRQPGDAKFALGPHVDGGSVERWEEEGYGLGKVFDAIWRGKWESFDPWEATCRLPVNADLHQGVGACNAFRMFQGWLSLSTTGPHEGTLLVNPLLAKATAYYLLRPFFSPKRGVTQPNAQIASEADATAHTSSFLDPDNWILDSPQTSWMHGATPGHGQELSHLLHPHLRLQESMIHIPTVRPGDYVAWHCDTIHAVDKTHAGSADSTVLYIPACPMTEDNANFLVRQRGCFVEGTPSPDFGGGVGEKGHVGRVGVEDMDALVGEEGCRSLGLAEWDSDAEGLGPGERVILDRANKILGFYD
ncbi:hypothetical protein A1F94_013704 [Pyrenophora tritici-repentis]|uniref:DUF1479 containing protein n=1 Tax=Pyrenophora tritici-repentis TaxID=45151 RepID=A0A2W1F7F5_9PLEO|nr:DUF1479 domain protein [Pyrenophora tritici-repentis]KAF7446704.1 DUF1479 domain protein [Pyrenophora tritici-repentis]KAG9375755.1 hypothetical protein A1F94_013704 [Pyrenophora tritici-repentis]KAI0583002.1 DUF1479 domain protein [Pyrenophora tritici-repentis]KAI0623412.1 DUF1479 domain protein [Pyrenophora tritici-repentis]